jgi:hypothetical protein
VGLAGGNARRDDADQERNFRHSPHIDGSVVGSHPGRKLRIGMRVVAD